MATILKFDLEGVREQWAHATAATVRRYTFGEAIDAAGGEFRDLTDEERTALEAATPAALHFVKDEGVYVMSNGTPRLMRDPDAADEVGKRSKVVYAVGFDPDERDRGEVWEEARAACGGDDFVEAIGADVMEEIFALASEGSRFFVIELGRDSMRFAVSHR